MKTDDSIITIEGGKTRKMTNEAYARVSNRAHNVTDTQAISQLVGNKQKIVISQICEVGLPEALRKKD